MENFEKAWSIIAKESASRLRRYTGKEYKYSDQNENYRKRHGQLKVFCVGMREPISPTNGFDRMPHKTDRQMTLKGHSEKEIEAV